MKGIDDRTADEQQSRLTQGAFSYTQYSSSRFMQYLICRLQCQCYGLYRTAIDATEITNMTRLMSVIYILYCKVLRMYRLLYCIVIVLV